ncbi:MULTISPECIES: DUF6783 domain-containing protein [Blautia]|nr:DUF6783 domain-containing protein [Blautia wexlerae]MDU2988275.1 DUF6783 domain-containing protein [Lachnospiraceae bacterium]
MQIAGMIFQTRSRITHLILCL